MRSLLVLLLSDLKLRFCLTVVGVIRLTVSFLDIALRGRGEGIRKCLAAEKGDFKKFWEINFKCESRSRERCQIPSSLCTRLLGNRHVVRMELWSFHGWKSGTSAVLFSMAAEAGGRKWHEVFFLYIYIIWWQLLPILYRGIRKLYSWLKWRRDLGLWEFKKSEIWRSFWNFYPKRYACVACCGVLFLSQFNTKL